MGASNGLGDLPGRIESFGRRVVANCGKHAADDITQAYRNGIQGFYDSYTPVSYKRHDGLKHTSKRRYSNKGLRAYGGVEIADFGMGSYDGIDGDTVLSMAAWNSMHGYLGPITGPAAYYEAVNLRDAIVAEAQAYTDIAVAAAGGI